MTTDLMRRHAAVGKRRGGVTLPTLIAEAGKRAGRRFVEFFTANIRNPNTRRAYARAVGRFFRWCDVRGITLDQVEPVIVAAYIEELTGQKSRPTIKQHLAAVKMLLDWLTTGGVIPFNPAA